MGAARRPLALFALAAAGLGAELAWTRVAGLLFFGDAAYLVVSLAVAGLAAGAALGAARPALLGRVASARSAAAAGAAILLGLLVALALGGRGGLPAALAASFPGFAALGLASAGVFAGDPGRAPRLYRADLLGAAAGAAASLPLLGSLGAPAAAVVAAALAAAAGAVLAPAGAPTPRATAAVLAVAALLAATTPWPDADARRWVVPKPMAAELARGGEAVASAWGTMGRSDLVVRADGAEILYLDGGAGSLVPTTGTAPLWRGDLGRLPFDALRPERVFVVGAGAGLEVAHALESGAAEVVAAEVNGAGAALARARLAGEAGGPAPFRDERVAWRRDEARSVLRADGRAFDLIALSQAVTETHEARGLGLTQNGLYTVEAFGDWLDALARDGAVSLELYDELTLTRALATAVAALGERGVSEPAALDHLFAVLDAGTTPPTPLLLAFREALDREAAVRLARAAEGAGLALLHVPGLLVNPPLDAVAAGERPLAAVLEADDVDLRPATDDAPFFWSFEPGLPAPLRRLSAILVAAAVAAAAAVAVGGRGGPPGARRAAAQVGLAGMAFLAVELAVLARAGLLLGHPAAALAVTLGGLLAGGGIGAGAARRAPDRWGSVAAASAVAAAATLAWALAWPPLAAALAGAPAPLRAAAVLAAVVPLGIALGAPFPLALRRIGADGGAAVARAWATSGLGSLLGGAGAAAIAHLAGFSVTLATAAAVHALAALLAAGLAAAPEAEARATGAPRARG